MTLQGTLRKPVRFEGIGLHSGKVVNLEVTPGNAGFGIKFQRTDVDGAAVLDASVANITSTELSTSIGSGSNRISTIEHLMAAFAGLGIDNAMVRVSGPEMPILDGSSAIFVEKFLAVGVRRLKARRRQLIVKKAFEVRRGDKLVRVEPASRTRFSCSIDFGSGVIGRQSFEYTPSHSAFIELSEARTFCHLKEVNAMREAGLALGGSLENAVVVTDSEILNAEGLRSENEFVRHKLLDAIGDLALLGGELVGKITLVKSGHGMHAEFMHQLMQRHTEYLEISDGRDESSVAVVADTISVFG
jgi:UDP-3-O-[3-hydroxymyristoyl] N-acetylglucosamine deacetylase